MGQYRTAKNPPNPKTKEYDESERVAALELAATVGVKPASEHLGISRKTLYRWIDKYPKLWSDLRAGDPAAHKRQIAARLEDLADRYAASEHDLLDRVDAGQIKPKDAKEAAALLKAFGSSRQAAVAGARQITGEPERVEHTINFADIEQAMERLLGSAPPVAVENLEVQEHVDALPAGS